MNLLPVIKDPLEHKHEALILCIMLRYFVIIVASMHQCILYEK